MPARYLLHPTFVALKRTRIFRKGEELELTIERYAFGGQGIARVATESGQFTVFVENTFPGQLVRARVVACKARHATCALIDVVRRSPDEADTGFQEIPGAPYARVPIDVQRKFKEETVLELFARIGGIEDVEAVHAGWVASPAVWHYRNKMEYSFGAIVHNPATGEKEDRFGLGFKRRGTWWAIENLDRDSGLFDQDVEEGLAEIRTWCEATGLPPWHAPRREGFYRFLAVRKSRKTGGLLVNLVTTSHGIERFDLEGFTALLRQLWGARLEGLLHTINDDTGERVEARDGQRRLVTGREHLEETLNGLTFHVQMPSFFQTNPASAEMLYAEVVRAVQEGPKDGAVLDLFCGTGTIAQLIARGTDAEVVGVELAETAIADAEASAARNGLGRIRFHAADVGKFLDAHPEYAGRIACAVVDPPRAGIAPKTLQKVIALGAQRIVYVSCNPATQARDVAVLQEAGYRLKHLKLVDQFPHTAHVETIAIFEPE